MNKFFSICKSWLRWLVLFSYVVGVLLTPQTARASVGPCSADYFHHGLISANESWCVGGASTHYMTDDVIVQPGVTLTIAAGVTVDSTEAAWSKYIIVRGHLDIVGTAEHPVLLTRSINYPTQNWSGLYFDGSLGDGSAVINHAIIEHAGSNFLPSGCTGTCGNAQTAIFVKDLPVGKQVSLTNSSLRDNVSKGLFLVNSKVDVANTSFNRNKYPILIEGAASVITYSGNTFSDNAYPYYDNTNYIIHEDSIFINPGALMGHDFSLPAQTGLEAYVFFQDTNLPSGHTMTIEPGVMLRFAGEKYLSIQGHLNAAGTLALPIHFTGIPSSDPAVSLNWGGLFFDGVAGDGSGNLEHAYVEYSGSNFLPPGCTGTCGTAQTAVVVKDLPAGKQVNIHNSSIQNNLTKGLYVANAKVDVANTSFSRNKYPILIEGAASVVTYSGNTFSDNAYPYYDNANYTVHEDSIFISPGALMGHDFSLPAQTGLEAYVFTAGTTVPNGRTMTLDPGVTVRTAGDNYINVLGHLAAAGTQTLPIRFTGMPGSDPAVSLNWGGLYFDGAGGSGSGNILHARIDHAGINSLPPVCSGACGSAQTALFVKDLPANKQVILNNSIIEDSLNKSLYIINSPTVQINNNLIKGGRVGAFLASNLTISNLALIDQALDGVVIPSGFTVEGRHLTIARSGQAAFHVQTGGIGLLKNSILSQNALAVWAESGAQASLNTNLADANTVFKTGTVTELNTFNGPAVFKTDGFHIQNTSAAISRAQPGLSGVDIDGEVRPAPSNSRPDLGADEVPVGRWWIFVPFVCR